MLNAVVEQLGPQYEEDFDEVATISNSKYSDGSEAADFQYQPVLLAPSLRYRKQPTTPHNTFSSTSKRPATYDDDYDQQPSKRRKAPQPTPTTSSSAVPHIHTASSITSTSTTANSTAHNDNDGLEIVEPRAPVMRANSKWASYLEMPPSSTSTPTSTTPHTTHQCAAQPSPPGLQSASTAQPNQPLPSAAVLVPPTATARRRRFQLTTKT
jgi:hypothetical protein